MIDQKALNIKHAKSPKVGDFWREMGYIPIACIQAVNGRKLIVEFFSKSNCNLIKMDSRTFKKYISYGSRDGTWADVEIKC